MPLTGYQDWQRVNYAAGEVVVNVNQAITVTTGFRALNLSGWPYLNLTFFMPAGSDTYSLQFLFYSDSTFSLQVASPSITVNSDMNGFLCVPVITPWLSLNIVPKAGGNATVITVSMYGTQQLSKSFDFATFATPLVNGSSALAINGVASFFTFTVVYGQALLHLWTSSANPMAVDVAYFDFGLNAYKTYLHYDAVSSTAPVREIIAVPVAQLRITLTNGGVAQTCNVTLTMTE